MLSYKDLIVKITGFYLDIKTKLYFNKTFYENTVGEVR